MLKLAVLGAERNGRHIGICGEAPPNYPEIARYLAQLGIDSISVNPSSILQTMEVVSDPERSVKLRDASSKAAASVQPAPEFNEGSVLNAPDR